MPQQRIARKTDIHIRHLDQRESGSADEEVVDGKLHALRCFFIELRAGGYQFIQLAIHRQIEMRYFLHGLREAARNRLAHPVQRHFLVSAFFVEGSRIDARHGSSSRLLLFL